MRSLESQMMQMKISITISKPLTKKNNNYRIKTDNLNTKIKVIYNKLCKKINSLFVFDLLLQKKC